MVTRRMRRPAMLAMCSVTGLVGGASLATSQRTEAPAVASGEAAGVVDATAVTPESPVGTPAATAAPAPTSAAVPPASSPTARATAAPPAAPKAAVTVNGAAYRTRYGPVQVRITVREGRITGADAIAYPAQDGREREINDYAVPVLNQEVLDVQSAEIDTVSGATLTSTGYRQSLQSALDAATRAGAL